MPAHDVLNKSSELTDMKRLLDLEAPRRDRFAIEERHSDRAGRKCHSVAAEIDVPAVGAEGLIVAQAGGMGAWSLTAHEGRLEYRYSYVDMLHSEVTSTSPLPAGRHQVRMEFTRNGVGIGKGGWVSLYVDGRKVGEGRIQRTHALFFSQDERVEIGRAGDAAEGDAKPRSDSFNGKIHWVQIDVDGDKARRTVKAVDSVHSAKPQ